MASDYIHKEPRGGELRIITLTRKEATDMIALLVAELAGEVLTGNASGAIANANITEHGVIKYRMFLTTLVEKA
jgi:hypothetical protein